MEEFKIKKSEIESNNVKSAPDYLRDEPQNVKNVFDKLPELIADKFNILVDNLYSKEQVDEHINNKVVEIGAGDMAQAIYDKNSDGIVNKADLALDSEKLDGKDATDYALADEVVKKSGGTMTGALTLHGEPTEDMHAATKKYVDNLNKKDLLWENANINNVFAEQSINLNKAEYKFLSISFRMVKEHTTDATTVLLPNITNFSVTAVSNLSGNIATRVISITDEGVKMGVAFVSSNPNNSAMVPSIIMGYR